MCDDGEGDDDGWVVMGRVRISAWQRASSDRWVLLYQVSHLETVVFVSQEEPSHCGCCNSRDCRFPTAGKTNDEFKKIGEHGKARLG